MATYKVLQDIEAEDKLIGPLTLRQCIYAAVAILASYLSFIAITKHATFLVIFFFPFIAFGVFFAFPWTKQQSTEVWALAKIRFMLKPRKRIWDQSGVKELVTVTAPKQVEDPRQNRMSENEVRSRLKALAETIDSRGWAVKNVPLNLYTGPVTQPGSDRLVNPAAGPVEVPTFTTTASDDMFDYANNPIAQQFDAKISAATQAHRQQLVQEMDHPQPVQPPAPDPAANPGAYWYLQQPGAPAAVPITAQQPLAAPAAVPQAVNPTAEDLAIAAEIKRKQELLDAQASNWHMVQPLSAQAASIPPQSGQTAPVQDMPAQVPEPAGTALQAVPAAAPDTFAAPVSTPVQQAPAAPAVPTAQTPTTPVTPASNPAILELANNNDLNIATIAREAHHITADASDEVVVNLH